MLYIYDNLYALTTSSTIERQFTGVRLVGSHLMPCGTVSETLTTGAFDPSRYRWFAIGRLSIKRPGERCTCS